jgi:hypothetical protein
VRPSASVIRLPRLALVRWSEVSTYRVTGHWQDQGGSVLEPDVRGSDARLVRAEQPVGEGPPEPAEPGVVEPHRLPGRDRSHPLDDVFDAELRRVNREEKGVDRDVGDRQGVTRVEVAAG